MALVDPLLHTSQHHKFSFQQLAHFFVEELSTDPISVVNKIKEHIFPLINLSSCPALSTYRSALVPNKLA